MPRWLGFDSVDHSYDPAAVSSSCPNWNNNLATYVAAKYASAELKFFCRYFDHGLPDYEYAAPGETGPFSAAGFHFIVPIAAPGEGRYTTGGSVGRNYGQFDGTDVCDNIVRAIQAGGMGFPPSGTLYVYLNVEPNFALTTDYWEGWSSAVRAYVTPWATSPMYPAVYATGCPSCHPANQQTTNVLLAHSGNPSDPTYCWGHWTQNPTGGACTWCNNAPAPDFSSASGIGLTLHYWQHGEQNACSGCDSCRPNVDNNQSNPAFNMMDYCLNVF